MSGTNGYQSVSNATPADVAAMRQDAAAPTNMVHAFLQKQGMPLTGDNVRRVLEANAANPGYIPGLMNNEPPSMPQSRNTRQPMASNGPVSGNALPIPPIPPQVTVQNSTMPTPPQDTVTDAGGSINGGELTALLASALAIPAIRSLVQGIMGGQSAGMNGSIPQTPPGPGAQQVGDVERVPQTDANVMPAEGRIGVSPAQPAQAEGPINWDRIMGPTQPPTPTSDVISMPRPSHPDVINVPETRTLPAPQSGNKVPIPPRRDAPPAGPPASSMRERTNVLRNMRLRAP